MVCPPVQVHALVVEDDPDYAWVLETLLRREGYAVTVANDGRTALACVATARPDLVTLDLRLPDVTGDDVLRQLRVQQPEMPVVVVSGEPDAPTRAQALGASAVLRKPVRLKDLLSTLAAVAPVR